MIGEMIQKSMLEWLQLTPELLSGRGKRAAAAESTGLEHPAELPAAESSAVAPITLAVVQPSTTPMGFFTPTPTNAAVLPQPWQRSMADAYSPDDGCYSSLQSGGSQRAALNEMTGYLTTRLAPAPARMTGGTTSSTDPVPPERSIANPRG